MIYALKGKIFEKKNTELIIDVNGVFYSVFVTLNTIEKVELAQELLIKTTYIIREDAHTLYGFLDDGEKQMFQMLIQIKNIGPKSAIGILSSVRSEDLVNYISTGNTGMLAKLPGIGKKTAERLHLELKDKIDKFVQEIDPSIGMSSSSNEEAISALVTLGFNRIIAQKAVTKAIAEIGSNSDVEKIIKLALKIVMK